MHTSSTDSSTDLPAWLAARQDRKTEVLASGLVADLGSGLGCPRQNWRPGRRRTPRVISRRIRRRRGDLIAAGGRRGGARRRGERGFSYRMLRSRQPHLMPPKMLTISFPAVSLILVSCTRNVSAISKSGGKFFPPNTWRKKSEKTK